MRTPFPQTVIAIIWDFDKTLIRGYMQKPIFEKYGVDEKKFWEEVQALPDFYRTHDNAAFVSADTIYLSHILTYVREGRFKGLNNEVLRELGKDLELYPGVVGMLRRLRKRIESDERFSKHGITVEHYVVSTGLRQMILGSPIRDEVVDVWACEFLEQVAPPGFLGNNAPKTNSKPVLQEIAYAIDNTTKTRAIFEINKGVNKHHEIDVNAKMPHEARRVPFENMIYIADGPSDVPVFSVLNRFGGKTFAVYDPKSELEFRQVTNLHEDGRVQGVGPADYRKGTQTDMWLSYAAERIASRISSRREKALNDSIGKPPEHLIESATLEAPQDRVGVGATEEPRKSSPAPVTQDASPKS
jgi:hypothetical protein